MELGGLVFPPLQQAAITPQGHPSLSEPPQKSSSHHPFLHGKKAAQGERENSTLVSCLAVGLGQDTPNPQEEFHSQKPRSGFRFQDPTPHQG